MVIDPERLRRVGKGGRNPAVKLAWKDVLSSDAALTVALNASVGGKPS